jgi:hypothetical protein
MKLIKPLLLSATIAAIGFTSAPAQAGGTFFSQISNPFVFCKLPKPCKACQPFRKIHEELCKAGQPSAEAKQQYNQAISQGQQNGSTLSAEEIQNQFNPEISSAYNDEVSPAEIEQYITWLSRQAAPAFAKNNSVVTMADYWRTQGITNYMNDATIRATAIKIINDRNQYIVNAVSKGSVPQNAKPWLNQRAGVAIQPDISTTGISQPRYNQQVQ